MSGNNIKISVIMNCYNSDKFLSEAIESVLIQTYDNFELIFWDNQSTDDSANIAKSYNDNRIKYYYAKDFTSLGNARNLAISKTNGKWVAFLDADDIWHKDKLRDSIISLNNNENKDQVALIYTNTTMIDDLGKKIGEYTRDDSGYILDSLLKDGNFVVQSSIMIKKEIFHSVNGINPDLTYCPDYDLLLKVTKDNITIGINKFLTYYRVHDGSITSTKMYDNYIEEINFMINYVAKNKLKFVIKLMIQRNITYKVTVLFVKLILQKEFRKVFIVIEKYFKYLLFSLFITPNIIMNLIIK